MKLATYDDGSRDGQLVVVSRDLSQAHYANGIASRLQPVLDDWNFLAPQLEDLAVQLNQGRARHAFAFEPTRCKAPLPRAHHWRAAVGVDLRCWPGDLARPGTAPVPLSEGQPSPWPALGVAAISGDVAAGTAGRDAIEAVRLLMLVQAWRAGEDVDGEPLHLTCAPVLVTPDELGGGWRGGRLMMTGSDEEATEGEPAARLFCQIKIDGRRAPGRESQLPRQWPNEGHLGDLIAASAARRALGSGSVLTWQCPDASPPLPVAMGQRLRAEVLGPGGHSVFGALDQRMGGEPPQQVTLEDAAAAG